MLITEPAAYKHPVRFAFSARPVPPTLLFRILYGVFICFDRNFKKGERKAKKSMINPKHLPARIHSFIHLATQKTRHAQTLIRECFAFSTHPCVFQARFYESSDGEFISAGKCFNKGEWEEEKKKKLCYFTSCMASSYVLTSTSRMRFNPFLKYFVTLTHRLSYVVLRVTSII